MLASCWVLSGGFPDRPSCLLPNNALINLSHDQDGDSEHPLFLFHPYGGVAIIIITPNLPPYPPCTGLSKGDPETEARVGERSSGRQRFGRVSTIKQALLASTE